MRILRCKTADAGACEAQLPSGTPSPFDVALARVIQMLPAGPYRALIRGTVWSVP